MPTIYRATAVLSATTQVAKDDARNVWHFQSEFPLAESELADLGGFVGDFYIALEDYLSSGVSSVVPSRVELAEVNAGADGEDDDVVSPLMGSVEFQPTPNAGAAISLPPEVAVALSFRGNISGVPEEAGLTRPRARRRGRVFLGPLNASVIAVSSGQVTVQGGFRTDILNAYEALIAAVGGMGFSVTHVVYSRKSAETFTVTEAHVDGAFDTIRGRGLAATIRSTVAVAQ